VRVDDYQFMVDSATKFFNSVYLHGWFHHPNENLHKIRLNSKRVLRQISSVGQFHGGVEASLGPNKGFTLQALLIDNASPEELEVEFIIAPANGWFNRTTTRKTWRELCDDARGENKTSALSRNLSDFMKPGTKVLDIGGRARSGIDYSKCYPGTEFTVLDVLPGKNVDVVGDAHELSRFFAGDSFDVVFSVSVFEHLLMPWRVVTEINKVLKPGGIGFVHTHQTIGLHDMPWDFWRFSEFAWDALFNKRTGFEIIGRAMDELSYVLPYIYRPEKLHVERSGGFEGSAVLFRKIGPCDLCWDVHPSQVIDTTYPCNDDDNTPPRL
jgi:Methyltransferase domain